MVDEAWARTAPCPRVDGLRCPSVRDDDHPVLGPLELRDRCDSETDDRVAEPALPDLEPPVSRGREAIAARRPPEHSAAVRIQQAAVLVVHVDPIGGVDGQPAVSRPDRVNGVLRVPRPPSGGVDDTHLVLLVPVRAVTAGHPDDHEPAAPPVGEEPSVRRPGGRRRLEAGVVRNLSIGGPRGRLPIARDTGDRLPVTLEVAYVESHPSAGRGSHRHTVAVRRPDDRAGGQPSGVDGEQPWRDSPEAAPIHADHVGRSASTPVAQESHRVAIRRDRRRNVGRRAPAQVQPSPVEVDRVDLAPLNAVRGEQDLRSARRGGRCCGRLRGPALGVGRQRASLVSAEQEIRNRPGRQRGCKSRCSSHALASSLAAPRLFDQGLELVRRGVGGGGRVGTSNMVLRIVALSTSDFQA